MKFGRKQNDVRQGELQSIHKQMELRLNKLGPYQRAEYQKLITDASTSATPSREPWRNCSTSWPTPRTNCAWAETQGALTQGTNRRAGSPQDRFRDPAQLIQPQRA